MRTRSSARAHIVRPLAEMSAGISVVDEGRERSPVNAVSFLELYKSSHRIATAAKCQAQALPKREERATVIYRGCTLSLITGKPRRSSRSIGRPIRVPLARGIGDRIGAVGRRPSGERSNRSTDLRNTRTLAQNRRRAHCCAAAGLLTGPSELSARLGATRARPSPSGAAAA